MRAHAFPGHSAANGPASQQDDRGVRLDRPDQGKSCNALPSYPVATPHMPAPALPGRLEDSASPGYGFTPGVCVEDGPHIRRHTLIVQVEHLSAA